MKTTPETPTSPPATSPEPTGKSPIPAQPRARQRGAERQRPNRGARTAKQTAPHLARSPDLINSVCSKDGAIQLRVWRARGLSAQEWKEMSSRSVTRCFFFFPHPLPGPARLRLVDGDFGCSGFVELHRQGLWGAVAESPGIWPELATGICQELHCGTSIDSRSYAKPERGSHLPVRWEVVESCRSDLLLDCFNRTSARRGEEPAFIVCSGKTSPQRGPRSFPGPLACPGRAARGRSGAAGCFPPCRGVRTPEISLGWMPGRRLAGRLKPWARQQPHPHLPPPPPPSTHSCSCSPACEGKTGNLPGALGSWQRHPQPRASNAAALQVGKPGEREQRIASAVLAPQNPTRACGVWRQSPAPCSSILLRCLPRASPCCEHLPCHEHLPAERLGAGAAARRAKPRGEERACFGSCHLPELKSPPVGFGGLTGRTAAAGRAGFHRCVSQRDSSKLLNAWPRYGSHVSPRSQRHKGKPRCREHPWAKSWSRRKEDHAPAGCRAPWRRP